MASSFNRLKELNLSNDEITRIGKAFENQEFRQLFVEYVDEIQDPNNRKIYEEEIQQLERERGQEVTFLHPNPGYVLKTSINGNQKCFINICSNENLNKPNSSGSINKNGVKGLQWALPHSLSPPHEDIDNKGVRCQVYDVLFHPDTLHLAHKNPDFRAMVNSVALEAIETNFDVSLDKKNLKFPKMSYKGVKRASILRKPCQQAENVERTPEEEEFYQKIYEKVDAQRAEGINSTNRKPKNKTKKFNDINSSTPYTTPKYLIKHRSHIDMEEFTEHKNAKINSTVPKELIIEINLPLLKGSNDINLDVTEKTLQLISELPAKYKLNLTLPYHVNDATGTARFDKDLKKLVITLPVVRRKNVLYDSGVESCIDSLSMESDDDDDYDDDDYPSEEKAYLEIDKDDFLNASEMYNLPEFSFNIFENIIAFTFNVKNVDVDSVSKRTDTEKSLVRIKFTNISATFYPTNYAFFVKFPLHGIIIDENDVNIETWDNNVILQIPLKTNRNHSLESFFYGLKEDQLSEKFIEEPRILSKILEAEEIKTDAKNITNDKEKVSKENISNNNNTKALKATSSAIDILATSYESSGDELSGSSLSPYKRSKGILKRLDRNFLGRSMSESSLDEFCSSFDNNNLQGSIECVPEDSKEDDEGMSSSFKKTVRFNDVVLKQLFRSNSSILGQKKKNQRKSRNKKRAHVRRYSESETSDGDTKKEGEEPSNNNCDKINESNNKKNSDDADKKEDSNIFHLEINN